VSLQLYFLRSSERKIVADMFCHTGLPDELFETFTKNYGLTTKDLGLYALKDNVLAGGVWLRKLDSSSIPTLVMAVKPEFQKQGIGSAMLEQLFLEAGSLYEKIKVNTLDDQSIGFFKKFGFIEGDAENSIMTKEISNEAVVRPSDGYDPRKWMD